MTKFAYLASGAAALVFATSALAADLPYRRQAPVDSLAPVFTTFTWTGGYVGANLGWRATNFDPVMNSLEISGRTRNSIAAGGHIGYNLQVAPNVVVGVEGDMGYGQASTKGPTVVAGPGLLSSRSSLDWAGSVRGRLGYAQDQWMVYGTGGLAFADLKVQGTLNSPGATWTTTNDKWAVGYTVGAGVEYMATQNIVLRAEYLYADYGRNTVAIPNGGHASVEVDTHTVRAGASYKF